MGDLCMVSGGNLWICGFVRFLVRAILALIGKQQTTVQPDTCIRYTGKNMKLEDIVEQVHSTS